MTKQLVTIIGTGLLTFGLMAAQTTQPAPGSQNGTARAGRHARGMGRMLKRLGLTPDQQAQAKQIFQSTREANTSVRDQMLEARKALREAVKANAPDAEIDRLSQNVGALTAQMTASRTKAMAKLYSILTPEQKAKLDQAGQRGAAMRNGFRRQGGWMQKQQPQPAPQQ